MVFGALEFLVQAEAKAIVTFVPDGQIREYEVASWVWALEVDHSRNRSTGEDGHFVRVSHATGLGQMPRVFQGREEEVVGVHHEGNVLDHVVGLDLEDLELHYRWRVHRSAVGRCCMEVSTEEVRCGRAVGHTLLAGTACAGTHGLLEHLKLIPQAFALAGQSGGGAPGLVGHGDGA